MTEHVANPSSSGVRRNFQATKSLFTSASHDQSFAKSSLHSGQVTSGDHPLCYPDIHGSPSCDSTLQVRHKFAEPPNFKRIRMLLLCLILTTALAVGSALDARNECVSVQQFAWMKYARSGDMVDMDDIVVEDEQIDCLDMFRLVILPVGGITVIFGLLALIVINNHLDYLENFKDGIMPSPLPPLLKLLPLLMVVLFGWAYGIFSIMLRPKVDTVASYAANPYKSLAAVDQMGYVGDNANLYYLSWMSLIFSMVLVYKICVGFFRWIRKGFNPQPTTLSVKNDDGLLTNGPVHEMLSFTSAKRLSKMYRERRKTWYQSMLKLRGRSGFWVAAFVCSIIVLASSSFLYFDLLVSIANETSNEDFRYSDVCSIIRGSEDVPEQFCTRTSFCILSGSISSLLCIISMILHLLVRRKAAADDEQSHVPDGTELPPGVMDPRVSHVQLILEFILSLCLSFLLGINAIIATGVQGPASRVGNLYYGSWIAFLLCLRICLGCLEEVYNIDFQVNNTLERPMLNEDSSQESSLSGSEISINLNAYNKVSKKERPARLRKYFFLAIFSTVCAASSMDAAYNQRNPCSPGQLYLIYAPSGVALLSVILFILCLKPRTYSAISHICCGGLLSVVSFFIWLAALVITMHSDDSWAVNGIGELKLANLYYFSWASIVTAGLQMLSYLKPLIGGKDKDAMVVVWATICKVCAVILGAAWHVWHNIEGACSESGDNIRGLTFCSRTIFAFIAGFVGGTVGWGVIGSRFLCCPASSRFRAKCEAALALFLVVFFGIAVALITSIGGPGQSVGDLYYATWLAFWVCIGIFVNCLNEMKQEEIDIEIQRYQEECAADYIDIGNSRSPNDMAVYNGRFA